MSEKQEFSTKVCFFCGIGFILCIIFAAVTDPTLSSEAGPAMESRSRLGAFIETELEMDVTSYCPCEKCCGIWAKKGYNAKGQRITASGMLAKGCFVAAPRNIPFGTLLIVPGYNNGQPVPVLDRGGAIKGNKLEVFFDSHQAALNWGRQKLTVKILERKPDGTITRK